ncbi:MAG TPA: hypothetical protein VIK89_05160, partial [Cytophagaceae bacterium]
EQKVVKAPKPPKPAKAKSESSVDGGKVFMIILIILLTGAVGYLGFDKFQTEAFVADVQKSNEDLKVDINSKLEEINHLQDSIKLVIAEKEALGLELADERAKLAELEDLKVQLQSKELSINALNNKLAGFQKNYNKVKASVSTLEEQNQQLLQEKQQLIEVVKAKEDSLKVLATLHAELAQKVAIASEVKAEGIDFTVFNSAKKEVTPSAPATYKAMLVNKIKVVLNLAQNEVITGKKEIYFRFIDASGTTLYAGDKSILINGKKIPYTAKDYVDFDLSDKPSIGFNYNVGHRMKPGVYKIEFYADNKKIGSSELILTK